MANECALNCLWLILCDLGVTIDMSDLRAHFPSPTSMDGYSLRDIVKTSEKLGVQATAFKVEDARELIELSLPCVVHLDVPGKIRHFSLLLNFTTFSVVLFDLSTGFKKISTSRFKQIFSGYIICFERSPHTK